MQPTHHKHTLKRHHLATHSSSTPSHVNERHHERTSPSHPRITTMATGNTSNLHSSDTRTPHSHTTQIGIMMKLSSESADTEQEGQ
ncbi:hypothetical protein E2C01_074484 [Portunus trituberculatus]|uniref:Uncharacterized protein n=1 Tax=Portunus trituberculatus TaxID=210409 RepID=A0A5B7IGE5_PORTR|nr:hypothetical protein [Portunus trituberculatus]